MLSACQSWFTKPHLRGPRGLQQLKLRQPVAAGVALRSAKWGGPSGAEAFELKPRLQETVRVWLAGSWRVSASASRLAD